MKNIHILATDKPSNITIRTKTNELMYSYKLFSSKNGKAINVNQNIYITNSEEIKEGDWYISILENEVYKATKETQNIMSVANLIGSTTYKNTHFKIILTTDQDLIDDGVQAIDNEFLEWFVAKANDSGKPIDIVDVIEDSIFDQFRQELIDYYKIIIPKEEPKQETLEEYIEKSYPKDDSSYDFTVRSKVRNGIRDGAKWQQERMYSEEDIREAYFSGVRITGEGWNGEYAEGNNPNIEDTFSEGFKEWFEQFKKK